MTTNELKSYVDRILGNNVRVLLPSYWWKRAFGAVIDKVDEADSKAASASLSAYRASQKADKASSDIQDKQDTLVSGKNIKTINGSSILGAGNITFNTSGYIVRSEKELNELNVSEGTVASIANKCVKIDNLKKLTLFLKKLTPILKRLTLFLKPLIYLFLRKNHLKSVFSCTSHKFLVSLHP